MVEEETVRQRLLDEEQEAADEGERSARDALLGLSSAPPSLDAQIDWKIATAFALLGAGMLWPFNAFITANTFFATIFAQEPLLLRSFSSAITFLFTLTNLVSVLYTTVTVKRGDAHMRIRTATLTLCVVLGLLAILSTLKIPARVYFGLMLLIVAVCGSMIGALQNGTFGIVGAYGGQYVPFIMIGQAVAGITPAVLSLAVDSFSQHGGRKAAMTRAFCYFLSSSLILVAAYFAHLFLQHQGKSVPQKLAADAVHPLADAKQILQSHFPWAVFGVFAVSLSVFPAVTATVSSIHHPARDLTVALGFVVWNTGDLAGRVLSGIQRFRIAHGRTLLVLSVLRIVFVPALYFCNVGDRGAAIASDGFFLGYMLLFGLTNGYVASLSMSGAIDQAQPEDKETVGAVMSLMLCLGLLAGSAVSFLLVPS